MQLYLFLNIIFCIALSAVDLNCCILSKDYYLTVAVKLAVNIHIFAVRVLMRSRRSTVPFS